VSGGQIQNYVWCADCQCSIHFWDTYRWHADQGHRFVWGNRSRRRELAAEQLEEQYGRD
jgi:hypothetical protein